MIDQDTTRRRFVSLFDRYQKSLNGELTPATRALQKSALETFRSSRFPTTRDEDWKYTNLSEALRHDYRLAAREDLPSGLLLSRMRYAQISPLRLVFVNGYFSDSLSDVRDLPRGITIVPLSTAFRRHADVVETYLDRLSGRLGGVFGTVNASTLTDGAFIHLAAKAILDVPVLMIFLNHGAKKPTLIQPRNLVIAERNSRCTLIETYVGPDDSMYLTNAVTEVFARDNAFVDHHKLQIENTRSYHLGNLMVHQQRSSNFSSHVYSLGAALARNETQTILDGEGVESTLNGIYLAKGNQHVDNRTMIDHARPHGHSWEVYKGILADKATAAFNGKILVRQDAQKTDAKQSNHALLLSPNATINSKPQLEIFADDVKCTHGATVGQLDDKILFYMRSRGIPKDKAEHLLTFAFAADIFSGIAVPTLKDWLGEAILQRLAWNDISTANRG